MRKKQNGTKVDINRLLYCLSPNHIGVGTRIYILAFPLLCSFNAHKCCVLGANVIEACGTCSIIMDDCLVETKPNIEDMV